MHVNPWENKQKLMTFEEMEDIIAEEIKAIDKFFRDSKKSLKKDKTKIGYCKGE